MQLYKIFFVIIPIFWTLQSVAQKNFPIHSKPLIEGLPYTSQSIDDDSPSWTKLLYLPNPNIDLIERLYANWRRENPDIVNGHTRNFKHLYRYLVANDGIDQEGFIKNNLEEQIFDQRKTWEKQRVILLQKQENKNINGLTSTDWVSLGPDMMYRNGSMSNIQANIYAIAQSASNPDIIYASSEAGGTIFRSNDKGDNWFSTTDNISFGGPRELEVDPFDPETVYVGSAHDIYKSTNGGSTWNSVYYNWNSHSNAIIIDPVNPQIIIASGHERIIRTTNGGNSWTEVHNGRAYDVKFKPGDPSVVYALMDDVSTLQTKFYKSTDGGITWNPSMAGWNSEASTSNKGGRMTVSDNNPGIIYCFVGADWVAAPSSKDGIKVMKSVDSGNSWNTVLDYNNAGGVNAGQGYYDWDIEVSDNDPDIVMLGTQGRWLTTDGFATTNWTKSGGELGHADLQEALFNGNDLWIANDGGIIRMTDETFNSFDIKMKGINATSFWSFDQGWNRDAQVGSHYHNGTSARTDSYGAGNFLSYGGAEPQFSAIKHPYPDKAWSKGYGAVNGKTLPDDINAIIKSFNYNITPNAEYGSSTWRESEIEVLPYAYNTHFTGSGNTLYRSDDFGLSWNEMHVLGTSDSKVTKIEIPRNNVDKMYLAVYDPSGYSLFRSTDQGVHLEQFSGPAGLSSDGVFISVDQGNEDVLYIASRHNSPTNNKVYKSIDGGENWINLSTSTLDGHSIRAILSVAGTDGGIYILSSNAVFYRNNSLNDWQILINNLPSNPALRDIKPYYKEGKIRVAGDGRGVWGADLYDIPDEIILQPSVNLVEQPCAEDTLYFDDFSVLNHDGAIWNWVFDPQPMYVDNVNIRNPKVVFGQFGSLSATMNVSVGGMNLSKEMPYEINVDSGCEVDSIAGHSYVLEQYGDHSTISGMDHLLDAFTYTMWVRPNEVQEATAFMVSKNGENVGINYYGSSKIVTIHYPGYNTWAYQSGFEANADEWTHLALTSDINTGQIILYVNGKPYNYTQVNGAFTAKTVHFEEIKLGWQHQWWGGRWFSGELDEFCLYKKALSQDEIRLQMHHTKNPTEDPDLIHYYQFNEVSGGQSFDKVGITHAETPSTRNTSRAPFGPGTTNKKAIFSSGQHEFPTEGVTLDFIAGVVPNGEVTLTKINHKASGEFLKNVPSPSYWIIHNYGSNMTFTGLNSMTFSDIEIGPSPFTASDINLHKRGSGQDGNSWNNIDTADQLENSTQTVTFDNGLTIQNFSQFILTNEDASGWIGVVSTDWDNPLNWGDGQIPTTFTNVIIPADTPFQPIVNINSTIKSLTLMPGAILRVGVNNEFKILD